MKTQHKTRIQRGWWARYLISGVGHVAAVTLIFFAYQSLFLTDAAFQILKVALGDVQLVQALTFELGIIYGLSACLWAFMYLGYLWIRESMRVRKTVALVKTRGTIIVETLIVFPVFLLFTFGLAQMAVNSMAGLLGTLATYQAARTIAVWGPEVGNNRAGSAVTRAVVIEKARTAAAGVMAPIAPTLPSEFATCDARNKTVNDMLSSMVGAGVVPTGAPAPVESFVGALDKTTFGTRGWYKLQIAFCRSEVNYQGQIITDGTSRARNQFTTNFQYQHRTAFPLMRPVFGVYSTIERTYELTQQISPNPVRPTQNVVRALISSISSPVSL